LLAGAGTLRAQLEVEVERLGLADRVRLLGERSDPDRLLSVADVVVLSSDWEGMPISLLEAMSIGVPIVATDVDGVSAAVGSEAALLVPPGDHERLAQALTSALTDNELRARMGRAGLQRSARKFSADAMVSSYSNLYKGLLSPISSSTRWAP
jgi:glycosyltransferase involved in cell wall biosynthesis